ncbi:MAG: hypothetical protein K8T26_15830 [Lentisphaerae bacterium]|nr:hypothetical protein [Lentisphaerota bacterium]
MGSLRVISNRLITQDLFALTLERASVSFQPGDCVALANPALDSRPYSMASGTGEDGLRFYIRRMSGGAVSAWLATRQPGDTVDVSPPFGWFRPAQSGPDVAARVFIATGTGVAPFLSALRSDPDCRPLALLYGARVLADVVELPYIAERCPLTLAISRENAPPHHHGHVTDLLDRLPPQPPGTHYYMCGLNAMVDAVGAVLTARGVPFTHLHREVFFNQAPPPPAP